MAEKVKAQDADWRKWKRELDGATKREKAWLKQADNLYKQYRAGEKRMNAFNMLYANTATLRPALYNGNTQPDVRRRFRDSDPLGKAVSETLDRALTYSIDCYDFDNCPKSDTLDALITDGMLEFHGLYREHPDDTVNWCHLTDRAPKSGRRTFKP